MIIEINKDIDKYQESIVLGLTARQLIFSVASIIVGGGIVLLLYKYIGLTGAAYVAGIFPKTAAYTPAMLMDGASLLSGAAEPETYGKAIFITIVSGLIWLGLSIPVMNRKQI